jgi:hypothetical protein
MKKLILFLAILSFSMNAQTKPVSPNAVIDNTGNYREIQDELSGRMYYNKEGKGFPVYVSQKGKLYIINGVSEKTGKPKKKYIVVKKRI